MAQLRKASVISLSAGDLPTASSSEISIKLRHPSLERQDSMEILDDLDLVSSTPNLSDLTPKKVKKKRHFNVFHRHKSSKRDKSPFDGHLGSSLPVQHHTNSNGLPAAQDDTTHLSLDSSWNQDSWNQLRNHRSSSMHSSNLSLLSAESEGRELSDEELVESLVYPRPSLQSSSPPPLELEASEGGDSMEYSVNVTLMSGHNLAVRDRTGSSDPYVKFKCPPFKHRSSIIHRNLNPEWNEHFTFRTQTLATPMLVRVYDHDYGSLDDYMGGQTLDLAAYPKDEQHILNLGLEDPSVKHENLGFIRICLKIAHATSDDRTISPAGEEKKQKSHNSKVWSSVLAVTLLEGSNFPPMDQNGLSDPYCKFKLGSQKYKSKAQSKTLNPKWMQRFDLRMYDDCSVLHIEVWDKDFPQNDDFIGMCSVNLSDVQRDMTHDFVLPLEDRDNVVDSAECTIHFKLCITATRVEEDQEETGAMETIDSYGILSTLDLKAIQERNIGHLCIKIDKVVDLVPCSCFVLVELGNSCVRTHPVGKSANPIWNKTFEFTVGDIHDELEVMVYKVGSRSDLLLGKIKIPLHRLRKGCQQFALKDKHCLSQTRGVLHIETALVYNPVRAMIRTINPKEDKLLEGERKFKKKELMNNIKRVSNLVRTILSTVEFIESTWSWESKPLSMISFLVFMLVVIFGELWMVFFIGVVVFLYQYVAVLIRNDHVWQNTSVHEGSTNQSISFDNHEDSDFSDSVDDKHTSLREKFRQFQEILVLVQVYLGIVADIEEGVKNLLNWSVPFLSWMAILVFSGGAVLFYVVPIRYVVLVWGINKYTKRLRKPNFISNNELIDFISRCPTNKQLQQWNEIPIHKKLSEGKGSRKRYATSKKTK